MNDDQTKVMLLRECLERRGICQSLPVMDCWSFLVQEVGEVGDALIRLGFGVRNDYVRNNEKELDLPAELCDVYFMLLSLANRFELDLNVLLDLRINDLYARR